MDEACLITVEIYNTSQDDICIKFDDIYEEVKLILESESRKYIWESNTITIEKSTRYGMPVIICTHDYNTNIDDEYIIVKIFLVLSRYFPNLLVKVYDHHGDFITIDGINCDVDLTDYNSYIQNGKIRLLSGNPTTIADSLQSHAHKELAETISSFCFRRISMLDDVYHSDIVGIPRHIAFLLENRPQLITDMISNITDDENQHHATDKKVETEIDIYAESLVIVKIRMTKSLFVRLFSHSFVPPRKSAWYHADGIDTKSPAFFNGYKITVGYANLMRKLLRHVSKLQHESHPSIPPRHCFQNERPGSQQYATLCKSLSACLHDDTKYGRYVIEPRLYIYSILSDYTHESFVTQADATLQPDDLTWLYSNLNAAEQMVSNRYEVCLDGQFIDAKLDSFVNTKSGLDGIDFKNSCLERTVSFDPLAIDNYLQAALDDFAQCQYDSTEEEEEEMADIMRGIGKHLGTMKDNMAADNVEDLMKSYLAQDSPSGPAFNLFTEIGFNPEKQQDFNV